ncbi:MAG: transketolase [Oscillospiraceae bacterium]|jgi:transketolase|nr:transketolase [Oscillospiraceae bacterium]
MNKADKHSLQLVASKARLAVIEGTFNAKSGHPGGSLSAVDALVYLYYKVLNVNPAKPNDPNRDRFVLSKGHAAPALYSVLAQKGYFPESDIKSLRKPGSHLQGHPDMNKTPGIDMSTGSLGQGFGAAAGMALAAKVNGEKWNVYTILGDGEVAEGIVWETAMFASHHKLTNLLAFIDNNGLQIDGKIEDVMCSYPLGEKFAAFGWNVIDEVDAHDFDSIERAVTAAKSNTDKPSVIILKSVKGKGVSFMENEAGWHGKATNDEQYADAIAELTAKYDELVKEGA